jgi:hypothetical protein
METEVSAPWRAKSGEDGQSSGSVAVLGEEQGSAARYVEEPVGGGGWGDREEGQREVRVVEEN